MHDVRAVDKSISHFDEGGPPIKAYLVHNMLANFRLKRNPAFLLWVKTSDTITVWYTKYQLACLQTFLQNGVPKKLYSLLAFFQKHVITRSK